MLIYSERIVKVDTGTYRGDFPHGVLMFVLDHMDVLTIHNSKDKISAALPWWNMNE